MTNTPLRLATIDLAAISHNVRTVDRLVGDSEVMAVVKANGYGHGAVEVARAALEGGATWLGVADVDEALELRATGITAPILAWLHATEPDFTDAVRQSIDLGISSRAQLDAVARATEGLRMPGGAAPEARGDAQTPATARVHLKIDTGLGRNGAESSDWAGLFERAAELESQELITVVGMFSHLSNANDEEDRAQLAMLESAVAQARDAGLAPTIIHLASTAAALRLPEMRLSLVRLGIGMYGLSPFDDEDSAALGLRPAMRLEGRVIAVKRVEADSGVSYGYTYRTEGASTLALVALGYADGIPRLGSNRAPVWINGATYTVSGRIAMDQFVVDVHDAQVEVGDSVVLFGDPATGVPAAEHWAESAETINYEIVTRVGGRIERRYTR
ncbi:alanine racemase [Subtercola sp. PAMC28395]|uniref:alanine racemase n=1 Tax=Subtercola sp. PAMC28395 TaxID=2846775 RepID=UPI001C0B6C9E|nr:alanine racemase [Subtercola sp. PAMC28395]QWT24007.1 alanine racemase [Subtercola sp. PAMC28395]